MSRSIVYLLTAAVAVVLALPNAADAGETIIGLTTQNSIDIIDSDDPNTSLDGGFIGGLSAGETLLGIDYRPADGKVYGFTSADNVYTLDVAGSNPTFAATFVGSFAPPRLRGNSFAFDFNPAFAGGEFARIISNTNQNRVISGDTGQYLLPVEKTSVFYALADPNLNQNPNIAGIAYSNNVPVSDSTQQFGIDATLRVLTAVANNAGRLETIGSLGLPVLTNELGFDISGDTGTAFASLQVGSNSELYTIDLTTGAATLIDTISSGDVIRDITILPSQAIPEPSSIGLLAVIATTGFLRRRR